MYTITAVSLFFDQILKERIKAMIEANKERCTPVKRSKHNDKIPTEYSALLRRHHELRQDYSNLYSEYETLKILLEKAEGLVNGSQNKQSSRILEAIQSENEEMLIEIQEMTEEIEELYRELTALSAENIKIKEENLRLQSERDQIADAFIEHRDGMLSPEEVKEKIQQAQQEDRSKMATLCAHQRRTESDLQAVRLERDALHSELKRLKSEQKSSRIWTSTPKSQHPANLPNESFSKGFSSLSQLVLRQGDRACTSSEMNSKWEQAKSFVKEAKAYLYEAEKDAHLSTDQITKNPSSVAPISSIRGNVIDSCTHTDTSQSQLNKSMDQGIGHLSVDGMNQDEENEMDECLAFFVPPSWNEDVKEKALNVGVEIRSCEIPIEGKPSQIDTPISTDSTLVNSTPLQNFHSKRTAVGVSRITSILT